MKEDKHIDLNHSVYVDMKKDLDEVGKGMCLAKWTQVTLQLQTVIIIVVTTQEHTK